jgi:hypothetical protein
MRTFAQKPKAAQQTMSAKSRIPGRAHFGQSREVNSILHLQRTIGNQAVQRMLQTNAEELEGELASTALPRFAHDFNQIPLHPKLPANIQAKLTVGPPGDIYEQQADRISEQVMRMPEPELQRACLCGGGLPRYLAGPLPQQHGRLMRTEHVSSGDLAQTTVPAIVHDALSSPGQPLDPATRNFMESRFERDFAGVRVHTDPQAQRSAQAVQARAYTVGRDIVFGAGQYSPATPSGQSLLAHELAHTFQSAVSARTLRRQPSDIRTPKPRDKHADPEWEIHLRARPNEIEIQFSDFLFEREVLPIVFKAGKLPPSFTLAGGGGSSITTRWVLTGPSGQDFSSVSSLLNERFVTRLAGERAKQRALEQKRSAELWEEPIREARARFRARHDDHSVTVLDNIDAALRRVTRNNPYLLFAYYDYYADHKLTDEIENEKWTGATASGDTDINPRVLGLDSVFKTSDPVSLLGGTLIHEYVHTPQGGKGTVVEQAPKEAKAYGIELFLAERMGDEKRADFIYKRYSNSPVDISTGSDKIFRATYNTMRALYEVIDSGRTQSDARVAGDISAEEARRMSVEFISRNEEDYGTRLKDFISKHSQ